MMVRPVGLVQVTSPVVWSRVAVPAVPAVPAVQAVEAVLAARWGGRGTEALLHPSPQQR